MSDIIELGFNRGFYIHYISHRNINRKYYECMQASFNFIENEFTPKRRWNILIFPC